MARPTRITVNGGDNSWEAQLNTNLQQLYDRPLPLFVHAGDLASLEAARPAAQFDQCMAWVDYDGGTTPGKHPAFSNGTVWKLVSDWEFNRLTIRSTGSTGNILDGDDLVVSTGASNIALTLPAIADSNEGRVVRIKRQGSGTCTVGKTGGDTIDGATTFLIPSVDDTFEFVSDGTSEWLVFGASNGAAATTFVGLSDTPANFTSQALKLVRVNAGATALEFVAATIPSIPIIVAVGDETTAITTGTAKVTFRMPYAFTVTEVRASLTTVSSSGIPTIDINESGTSILSTKLTIDASEKTSETAAAAAVISDASLADDAEITIDIDVAGTGAAGLKVTLIGDPT